MKNFIMFLNVLKGKMTIGFLFSKAENIPRGVIHSVHWGISHHPLFFAKPPLNLQTVQALPPLFREFPLIYWFFLNPS